MGTAFRKIAFLGILIGIWEVVYRLQIWPPFLFPSPNDVLKTLISGFKDDTFTLALAVSFRRLLIGFGLAVAIGTMLGVLTASFTWVDETLGSLILSLQSVPSIVWLPLALLWFQMGEAAIIFFVTLGGTWSMALSVASGIKNVPVIFIRAARTMGASGLTLFIEVVLPAAVPHLITGTRLAWAFSWRALMAGELIGTGKGLGQILMWGRDFGNMSLVIAVMIMIAVIGSVSDNLVFKKVETAVLRRWGQLPGSK